MPGFSFLQARNYYPGRRKKIRLIVWHDMEAAEAHNTAENVAGWFHGPTSPRTSAHVCCDDDSVVETVHVTDTAWHCPNANSDGVGIEQAGYRNQGKGGWRDSFSLATIRNACHWVASKPELAHIPDRFLDDHELADGVTPGHTTHEQCTRVLGGGTHTDPGPDFPKDFVAAQMIAARGGNAVPAVKPAEPRWLRFTNPRLQGQDVVNVRHALHLADHTFAEGDIYDQETAALVAVFQAHRGITERGVGPETRKALGEVPGVH